MKRIFTLATFLCVLPLAAFAGGITNVKEVVNKTGGEIKLEKREFTGNAITTRIEETKWLAAGAVWTGDMWIPWANNEEEYKNHFMRLFFKKRKTDDAALFCYYLWQKGEFVRYSDKTYFDKSSYSDDASKVPGEAQSGGERRLVVGMKDGAMTFVFEKYKK